MLDLLGNQLCFTFRNFLENSIVFHSHCSLCFATLHFRTFLETKEENRIPKLKPKPRMNFSTQAKQCVSQEQ